MEIKRVYVGGWFQRTRLHLGEIYDFLRDADSPLNLDKNELVRLQKTLVITRLDLVVDRLECIVMETENISLRIYEDGLITLSTQHSHDLQQDIKLLTDYYENKMSPALSYIFSLGAPVPKELANIKTVYPYFIVTTGATDERTNELFGEFSQTKYFTVKNQSFSIYRGDKLYIIDQSGASDKEVERFIEEQIFLREFRGQLHRYLNLHRSIWEQIADVKERGSIKGEEIVSYKKKVDEYAKTIDFISTRINQMGVYLRTRGAIAASDENLNKFRDTLNYKHETMGDTLEYIKDIWVLTQRYVSSAAQIFNDLQAKSTNTSVQNLTVVTSMGVGATLIGLFSKNSAPTFTMFGLGYFVALAVLGYSVNRFMKWYALQKKYPIKDTELAKEI
jgi:hypothetical protein